MNLSLWPVFRVILYPTYLTADIHSHAILFLGIGFEIIPHDMF